MSTPYAEATDKAHRRCERKKDPREVNRGFRVCTKQSLSKKQCSQHYIFDGSQHLTYMTTGGCSPHKSFPGNILAFKHKHNSLKKFRLCCLAVRHTPNFPHSLLTKILTYLCPTVKGALTRHLLTINRRQSHTRRS